MDTQQGTGQAGYCECGCGGLAPIAKKTRRGYRKGEPMRFIQGHHMRVAQYKAALYTEARNAKISAAHADGRIPPPERMVGSDHPSWLGADVGYAQAHYRVVAARGPAADRDCEECEMPAAEWALNHDKAQRLELHSGRVKPLSADVEAYVALCRSCHRTADRRGGYRA